MKPIVKKYDHEAKQKNFEHKCHYFTLIVVLCMNYFYFRLSIILRNNDINRIARKILGLTNVESSLV